MKHTIKLYLRFGRLVQIVSMVLFPEGASKSPSRCPVPLKSRVSEERLGQQVAITDRSSLCSVLGSMQKLRQMLGKMCAFLIFGQFWSMCRKNMASALSTLSHCFNLLLSNSVTWLLSSCRMRYSFSVFTFTFLSNAADSSFSAGPRAKKSFLKYKF